MTRPSRRERQLAAIAWILPILYFPLQLFVAAAWPRSYSFAANTISDLGVTTCGMVQHAPGRELFVCSPRHLVMNIGFVLFGIMTVAGAVLMWRASPRTRLLSIALVAIGVAGIGAILVGLAPADASPRLHRAGALLRLPGVLAPLLVAWVLWPRRPLLAAFSAASAAISLAGAALFALRLSPYWVGAAERLALDPFTVWLAVLSWASLRGLDRAEDTERPGERVQP